MKLKSNLGNQEIILYINKIFYKLKDKERKH